MRGGVSVEMMSMFVDHAANVAAIDLQPGRPIARTDEVGSSLLASYDEAGGLVSVEVLSLKAVQRPEVVAELHALLGEIGELNAGTGFTASPSGFSSLAITPRRVHIVDILIQQINRATVEDGNAQQINGVLV